MKQYTRAAVYRFVPGIRRALQLPKTALRLPTMPSKQPKKNPSRPKSAPRRRPKRHPRRRPQEPVLETKMLISFYEINILDNNMLISFYEIIILENEF